MNEVRHPGMLMYRETWIYPEFSKKHDREGKIAYRLFWLYFFFMCFDRPELIFGHFNEPDPSKWTDEELGIPPDDLGTYADWINERNSPN